MVRETRAAAASRGPRPLVRMPSHDDMPVRGGGGGGGGSGGGGQGSPDRLSRFEAPKQKKPFLRRSSQKVPVRNAVPNIRAAKSRVDNRNPKDELGSSSGLSSEALGQHQPHRLMVAEVMDERENDAGELTQRMAAAREQAARDAAGWPDSAPAARTGSAEQHSSAGGGERASSRARTVSRSRGREVHKPVQAKVDTGRGRRRRSPVANRSRLAPAPAPPPPRILDAKPKVDTGQVHPRRVVSPPEQPREQPREQLREQPSRRQTPAARRSEGEDSSSVHLSATVRATVRATSPPVAKVKSGLNSHRPRTPAAEPPRPPPAAAAAEPLPWKPWTDRDAVSARTQSSARPRGARAAGPANRRQPTRRKRAEWNSSSKPAPPADPGRLEDPPSVVLERAKPAPAAATARRRPPTVAAPVASQFVPNPAPQPLQLPPAPQPAPPPVTDTKVSASARFRLPPSLIGPPDEVDVSGLFKSKLAEFQARLAGPGSAAALTPTSAPPPAPALAAPAASAQHPRFDGYDVFGAPRLLPISAPSGPAPRAVLGYDTTGDGNVDVVDTNGDGLLDTAIHAAAPQRAAAPEPEELSARLQAAKERRRIGSAAGTTELGGLGAPPPDILDIELPAWGEAAAARDQHRARWGQPPVQPRPVQPPPVQPGERQHQPTLSRDDQFMDEAARRRAKMTKDFTRLRDHAYQTDGDLTAPPSPPSAAPSPPAKLGPSGTAPVADAGDDAEYWETPHRQLAGANHADGRIRRLGTRRSLAELQRLDADLARREAERLATGGHTPHGATAWRCACMCLSIMIPGDLPLTSCSGCSGDVQQELVLPAEWAGEESGGPGPAGAASVDSLVRGARLQKMGDIIATDFGVLTFGRRAEALGAAEAR